MPTCSACHAASPPAHGRCCLDHIGSIHRRALLSAGPRATINPAMRKLNKVLFALGIAALPTCAQDLPDGPGKETVQTVCTVCHGLEDIVSSKRTKAEWKELVDKMVSYGAQAKDEEIEAIVNYLAKNFGK